MICLCCNPSAWSDAHFSAGVLSPHNLNCPQQLPGAFYQKVCIPKVILNIRTSFFVKISFPLPAGNTIFLLYWRSVSSWCANATEEQPLIGSRTLTCCQLRTPAPPTSPMKSWWYCHPVCRERLGSSGKQCGKSTLLIKTFSGVCDIKLHFSDLLKKR